MNADFFTEGSGYRYPKVGEISKLDPQKFSGLSKMVIDISDNDI
jgi:hypothetical protein